MKARAESLAIKSVRSNEFFKSRSIKCNATPNIDKGKIMSRITKLLSFIIAYCLTSTMINASDQELDFRNQDLTNANFIHKDLAGANFSGATLKGVIFSHANLQGASFEDAVLGASKKGDTNFSSANLTEADFTDAKFGDGVDFQYANITSAKFKGVDTSKVIFGPTLYFGPSQSAPDFSKAKLSCEFSWYWSQLKTTRAKRPDCAGQFTKPKGYRFSIPETKTVLEKQETDKESAQPASVSTFNLAAMHLADQYKGRKADISGNSIFVSGASGVDSATCGSSYDAACKTISTGMIRCSTVGTPCSVLIEYGAYNQTSSLTLVNDVSLIGGYVGGSPSSNYQSSINGPSDGSPVFTGASLSTSLSNIIVNGNHSSTSGQAAIAFLLSNTTAGGVALDNVSVNAGTGSNNTATGSTGTAVNGNVGNNFNAAANPGAGGANTCSSNAAGGGAGTSWTIGTSCSGWGGVNCSCTCNQNLNTIWYGSSGAPGQSVGGSGTNEAAGNKACNWGGAGTNTPAGEAGGTGDSANVAAAYATSRIGNIDGSGNWTPVVSNDGNRGLDGGGGGGGGAGQPVADLHCPAFKDTYADVYNGVSGGGGGSGGCGAVGGGGGTMGGASFAMVLVNANVTLNSTSQIVAAQGGQGSDGGVGVAGGTGGTGGANCSCLNSAGQAVANCSANCGGATQSGAGGNGGNGGDSGGGAGGNGGPSVGVVLVGASTFSNTQAIYPNQSGVVGSGGAGSGTAPIGANGQQGLGQATYTVQ